MELFLLSTVSYNYLASVKRLCDDSSSNIETYSSAHCQPIIHSKVIKAVNNTPFNPSPYSYFDYHGQIQTFIQFNVRNAARLYKYFFCPKTRVNYTRELVKLRDGGTIALDWAYVNDTPRPDKPHILTLESPIVVMYHGLVGDSQSEYIIHLAGKLLKQGYRVVVMVARGCGGLDVTSGSLFAGSRIQDMHEAISHVKSTFPLAKQVFLLGYSLGAALSLQYLGSKYANSAMNGVDKSERMLTAAMAVSPPWLCVNHIKIPASWMFTIWSMLLVTPLKVYYLTHLKALMKYAPEKYSKINIMSLLLCKSVSEYDEVCHSTFCNAKDECVYKNLDEYYEDISPIHSVGAITTPTIVVSAKDDPICPHIYAPTDGSLLGEGLTVVKTRYGGHLAFPEGWLPLTTAWTDRLALEWLKQFCE